MTFMKIALILLFSISCSRARRYENNEILSSYDFIVVGAGPGGSVVANRLSEIPDWQVLLLEAGKEENAFVDIPAFAGFNELTHYNWNYTSEPQPGACLGLQGGRCRWPRGKGLGGTTLLNGMAYTRGNKADYDRWAELGNEGWSFDEVEKYFLKSENINIPELFNSPSHQRGGPVNIERIPYHTEQRDTFLEAAEELGYNLIDYNDGRSFTGFSKLQSTMKSGHRFSAFRGYLENLQDRTNLQISTGCFVTKLLINPNTLTAEGVEFVRGETTYRVRARKEVILSAGTLLSPQLLMLSGVGPREHLEELGIPLLKDLPVGKILREHVGYGGLVFVNENTEHKEPSQVENIFEYFDSGSGPLTVPVSIEAVGFVSTELNEDPSGRPDIELLFYGVALASHPDVPLNFLGFSGEIVDQIFKPIKNRETWTVLPCLLHPKSTGYMQLTSRNPYDPPKFYANYFENEHDLDTVVAGIRTAIDFVNTEAFQRFGGRLVEDPLEACASNGVGTNEYYKCATRHVTFPLHHQTGTCIMGTDESTSVVNSQLQVYGIKNLRVVDASIMPDQPSAHTQAVVYMIGEKASDMIKATWKKRNTY